jgi:hypothetical protein
MPRNNKDFTNGREKLESTVRAMGLGKDAVKDPFTGTTHVDLSDPKHPFNQPMFPDWKKDGDK